MQFELSSALKKNCSAVPQHLLEQSGLLVLWTRNKDEPLAPVTSLNIHKNSEVHSNQHFSGNVLFARKHLASKLTGMQTKVP